MDSPCGIVEEKSFLQMIRKPFADIKCLFRCKLKLQGACDSSGTYCAPAKAQRLACVMGAI